MKPRGATPEIRFEDSLEFEQRFVVEADGPDVLDSDAGLAEAVVDRVTREPRVPLLARETIFLRGRDDVAFREARTPRCRDRTPRCRECIGPA